MDADVLIQAGHEGGVRNDGKLSPGSSGVDVPEREMTPIVADAAVAKLQELGISTIRENAFFNKVYEVRLAMFLHFDGAVPRCSSGASVGYNDPTDASAATAWKKLYGEYWPFRFMPDNFTTALSGYYGYSFTSTTDAEFVVEFGEITCPEQNDWLRPRLLWLGELVAFFAATRLGHSVPRPTFQEDGGVMGWTQPGDPVENVADADAVFAYQGSFAPGPPPASYEPGSLAEANDRIWIVMARITDWIMRHHASPHGGQADLSGFVTTGQLAAHEAKTHADGVHE